MLLSACGKLGKPNQPASLPRTDARFARQHPTPVGVLVDLGAASQSDRTSVALGRKRRRVGVGLDFESNGDVDWDEVL